MCVMVFHAVDGAVPAKQLEQLVEGLRRNPSHPGRHIAATCERKSLSASEAAEQIGIADTDLTRVIEEQAPLLPGLALQLEAAGWSRAEIWMQMQAAFDLAQERLRRESASRASAPLNVAKPTAAASAPLD